MNGLSSPLLRKILALSLASMRDRQHAAQIAAQAFLRLDLSHEQYAKWFLEGKVNDGRASPQNFLNDFVLFRVARDWPKGAKWFIEADDLEAADFSLTEDEATELVEMAQEGLSDGSRPADLYARIAIVWYADQTMTMPRALYNYLQVSLFRPARRVQGRKRHDGLDRDRIIRNAFTGLRLRECPVGVAYDLIANEIPMITAEGVRKALERTPRTPREERLWGLIQSRWRSPISEVWPPHWRTELVRFVSKD